MQRFTEATEDVRFGDTIHQQPRATNDGHATIQPRSDFEQLNTDYDAESLGIDAKDPLKVGSSPFMDVDYIQLDKPLHDIRGYTAVTIKRRDGGGVTFYTGIRPEFIRVEKNKTINHINLIAAGSRWFTGKDLSKSVKDLLTTHDFKGMRDILGLNLNTKNKDFDVIRAVQERLKLVRGQLGIQDTSDETAIKDNGSNELKRQLLKSNRLPEHPHGGFKVDPSSEYFNRGYRDTAMNIHWLEHRAAPDMERRSRIADIKKALYEFRMDGGVILDFYHSDNMVVPGFRIFAATPADGEPQLLEPARKYLSTLSEIEAEFIKPFNPEKDADALYKEALGNLRKAYRDSRNSSNNGVVGFKELMTGNLIPRNIQRGKVYLTPTLMSVTSAQLDKMAAEDKQMDDTLIGALRRTIGAHYDSVRGYNDKSVSEAMPDNKAQHDAFRNNLSVNEKAWLATLTSYDHRWTGERSTKDKFMNGWTVISKKLINHEFSVVLVPPTVNERDRETIIDEYVKKQWSVDPTGLKPADLMAELLFARNNDINAYIALTPESKEKLQTIMAAAEQYRSLAPNSEEIPRMQQRYKFDEFRPDALSRKPVDVAEEQVMAYLNASASIGNTAKSYKAVTEQINKSFKAIYAGSMNGPNAVSHTLMQLGRIRLPDEKMTVLFGPSGALYKIVEYKGDKPTIEEVPTRLFSSKSLYMRVLKRLSDTAKGHNPDGPVLFTANNAFNFRNNAYQTKQFIDWADGIRENMESVRLNTWAKELKGLALYSRLQSVLRAGEFRKEMLNPGVIDTDKELNISFQKTTKFGHAPAQDKLSEESYNNVVKYIRGIYAEQALHEQDFINQYNVSEEVRAALAKHFQIQREELSQHLIGNMHGWRDIERAFDSTAAKLPGTKEMIKTAYELERAEMAPSILNRFTRIITDFIGKVYVKFVEGFHTMFDLMNPITILTNLQAATFDTLVSTFHTMFSTLFTNFIDRHFDGAPFAKQTARGVFDKLGVKLLSVHEKKLMSQLQGSNALAIHGNYAEYKFNTLQNLFRVKPNPNLTDAERAAFDMAVTGPTITLPNDKGANEPDRDEFDVIYTVKDRIAFRSDEFAKQDLESLKSRDTLARWWRDVGHRLLFPTYMGSSFGKENEYEEDNRMTQRLKDAFFHMSSVHNKVIIDGDDIRIRFKLEQFNMDPKSVYKPKSEVKGFERMTRTQADEEERLSKFYAGEQDDRMPKQRKQGAAARFEQMMRPKDTVSSDLNFNEPTGKYPYNADTGQSEAPMDGGSPSERMVKKFTQK